MSVAAVSVDAAVDAPRIAVPLDARVEAPHRTITSGDAGAGAPRITAAPVDAGVDAMIALGGGDTPRAAAARADTAVVLVAGKAPTKDRTTSASAVRSAARSGGWQLVETPLTESEVTTILACLKAPQRCLQPPVLRGTSR